MKEVNPLILLFKKKMGEENRFHDIPALLTPSNQAFTGSSLNNSNPFLQEDLLSLERRKPFLEISIRPRDFYKHYVECGDGSEAQQVLRWSFKTVKKSLGFGLFYLYEGKQDWESTKKALDETLILMDEAGGGNPLGSHSHSDTNLHSVSEPNLRMHHSDIQPGEMFELIGMHRVECGERLVKGALRVTLPGTYVLYFDNSASLSTPKQLILATQLANEFVLSDLGLGPEPIVCEGPVLKKKHRRLPGWSQRWLQLDSHGRLSYFEKQPLPAAGQIAIPRGIMELQDCTVSKVPSRLLITVDGRDTWHFRFGTAEDYARWDVALTKHVPLIHHDTEPPQQALSTYSIDSELEKTRILIERAKSHEQLTLAHQQLTTLFERIKIEKGSHDEIAAVEATPPTQEEDVFYDVEEIILSDISSSEYESEPEEEQVVISTEVIVEVQSTILAEPHGAIALSAWPLPGYRNTLPVPAGSLEGLSLASILRKNIGKDWSSLALPVALNEPLSMLQRLAEDLEYSDLLERAATSQDPVLRMALVTAFAVSNYAAMAHRVERKPFNPMLGETFQLRLPERGFVFMSEKVSHRPLIVASYAASLDPSSGAIGARWTFGQEQSMKSKFWGKSMEYIPAGGIYLTLPGFGESYTWGRVVSCVRNVLSATGKWVEFYGETVIACPQTGLETKLVFKSNGLFGSANGANAVQAIISNVSGRKVASLQGRWNEYMQMDGLREPLWSVNPMPSNHLTFFGFSHMALMLNQPVTDVNSVLSTDSRLRPDQRLLENGHIEAAEQEKQRIEQRQRDYRMQLEEKGMAWRPRWFESEDGQSWRPIEGIFDTTKPRSDLPVLW